MSGTTALEYEIKKNGRKPQEVIVNYEGTVRTYHFGPDVSKRNIVEMLPRLVLDFRTNRRKKAS